MTLFEKIQFILLNLLATFWITFFILSFIRVNYFSWSGGRYEHGNISIYYYVFIMHNLPFKMIIILLCPTRIQKMQKNDGDVDVKMHIDYFKIWVETFIIKGKNDSMKMQWKNMNQNIFLSFELRFTSFIHSINIFSITITCLTVYFEYLERLAW